MNIATQDIDWSTLEGKTILVTGAASGLGKAFSKQWASKGAFIIVGDVDEKGGKAIVAELRKSSGNNHHHFLPCDVTSWDSQLSMFKKALELSPGKHIDIVVANAGIGESSAGLTFMANGKDEPLKPNLKTLDIDLNGLVYTSHLAYWAFSLLVPSSASVPPSCSSSSSRPHSLLLLGSMASLMSTPDTPLYAAAKHGVLGLFRALRIKPIFGKFDRHAAGDRKVQVNVNMICPYYTETPIISSSEGRLLPPELELTDINDVVEAASRMITVPGEEANGRALAVGTKSMAKKLSRGKAGEKSGIWEVEGLRSKL